MRTEEIPKFISSSRVIRVITSGRMRLTCSSNWRVVEYIQFINREARRNEITRKTKI
jgi:hypothetical protein